MSFLGIGKWKEKYEQSQEELENTRKELKHAKDIINYQDSRINNAKDTINYQDSRIDSLCRRIQELELEKEGKPDCNPEIEQTTIKGKMGIQPEESILQANRIPVEIPEAVIERISTGANSHVIVNDHSCDNNF